MMLSILYPQIIAPFAQGVPATLPDDGGFLSGMKAYKYMRACYGISVCAAIGVIVTLFTKPEPVERQKGLVWGTVSDALRRYKGSPGTEDGRVCGKGQPLVISEQPSETRGEGELPVVSLGQSVSDQLGASPGDLLYVSDSRWWLGGLRSAHVVVGDTILPGADSESIGLHSDVYNSIVSKHRNCHSVVIEKLY